MFRVHWKRGALNQLATVWLGATDQNAVTTAAHAIDQALEQDPENVGESRPFGHRLMWVSPLGIRYRIYPDRKLVRVLACWPIRQV